MNLRTSLVVTALAAAVSVNIALAQEDGDGDETEGLGVTFRVLPENVELPDAVTRELRLPNADNEELPPPQQALDNQVDKGLGTANTAREDGRAFGQATAAAAQENVENLGRGSRPDLSELVPEAAPPDLSEVPPEPPGRPDTAGPPGE